MRQHIKTMYNRIMITWPKAIWRSLKWRIHRMKHGWADIDTWNFDEHITRVISEGVLHIVNKNVCYPAWAKDRKSRHRWNRTLRKIAKDIYIQEDNPSKNRVGKQMRAFRLLMNNLYDLWW